jgi:hypothetical protein
MKSFCQMPDLQVALLEAARLDETPETELSFHLEGCEDCQLAVERMRRMTTTWMTDPVAAHDTDGVIAAAHARFEARHARPSRRSWQDPASFVFVGAVAAALMLVVLHKVRAPSSDSVASVAANSVEPARAWSGPRAPGAREANRQGELSEKAARAVPHVEGPRGVTPLVDGLRIELKAGETAKVALANGQSSEVRGPCAVEFWSSSNEVGGWRLTPVEATSGLIFADPADTAPTAPSAGNAPPSTDGPVAAVPAPAKAPAAPKQNRAAPSANGAPAEPKEAAPAPLPAEPPAGAAAESASPKVQAAWVRAADAQRRDDFSGADSAYNELCDATDPSTRDAARLARAQLWIGHGRGREVRSVLVDLASRGATQLVRQTAQDCLSRQAP